MSGGHGHFEGSNKKIALLVAVLAACLAISEMGGKSAQTEVLTQHVEATNMWTFFQAKTVRQTVVRTAAEELDAQFKGSGNVPPAVTAQLEQWRKTAQRYDSEPETNEGRKELMARAKEHEAKREAARSAYHLIFSSTGRPRFSSRSCSPALRPSPPSRGLACCQVASV